MVGPDLHVGRTLRWEVGGQGAKGYLLRVHTHMHGHTHPGKGTRGSRLPPSPSAPGWTHRLGVLAVSARTGLDLEQEERKPMGMGTSELDRHSSRFTRCLEISTTFQHPLCHSLQPCKLPDTDASPPPSLRACSLPPRRPGTRCLSV